MRTSNLFRWAWLAFTLALVVGCGRSDVGLDDETFVSAGGASGGRGGAPGGGAAGRGGRGGAGGSRVCTPVETDCGDGIDNDCDKLTDCADPNCFGVIGCECGLVESSCVDGVDNDCNGTTDCNDPACASDVACRCQAAETCNNGRDDDCNGKADCLDVACKSDPQCACAASETSCVDGIDNDCNGMIDCDDAGCASNHACLCAGAHEICGNGVDDNCNGLIDCADAACAGAAACQCAMPKQPETCNDGVDNDCNGKIDCADPACIGAAVCGMCAPEQCSDGIDNNCDGRIDCADTACAFDPACAPQPEVCNNGLDDNHNGLTDCADAACFSNPRCLAKQQNCETARDITASGSYTGDTTGNPNTSRGTCGGDAGEAVFRLIITAPTHVVLDTDGTQFDATLYIRFGSCTAGAELACNDDERASQFPLPAWQSVAALDLPVVVPGEYFVYLDGYTVDVSRGPNEGPFVLNVALSPTGGELCGNGRDDNGNTYVDCADPSCSMTTPCQCNAPRSAAPEYGVAACTDGVDNDCNGLTDAADKANCNANAYYDTERCNGVDDNGNNIVDEFACRCASDTDCAGGQICYAQSVHACGPPCTRFAGDVCPFVAPGSTCNPGTGQCAF